MIKDINLNGGGVISGVLPVDTDGDGEDDTVYFVANGGTHGNELWKTDGTTSGTVMVKDIRSEVPPVVSPPYGRWHFTLLPSR